MRVNVVDARQGLVDVLADVMPARTVYGYPPQRPAPVAPAIYVATYRAGWADLDLWNVWFDVIAVADGDNAAAHHKLDELVDAVYRAVARSADYTPDAVQFDPFPVDAVTELPAYLMTVVTEIAAATWCPPELADPVPAALNGVPQ